MRKRIGWWLSVLFTAFAAKICVDNISDPWYILLSGMVIAIISKIIQDSFNNESQ